MKILPHLLLLAVLGVLLAACNPQPLVTAAPATPAPTQMAGVAGLYDRELGLQALQSGGCGACHFIPGVEGATGSIGPDLSQIGVLAAAALEQGGYTGSAKTVRDYLMESIQKPDFCGTRLPQRTLLGRADAGWAGEKLKSQKSLMRRLSI